MTNPINTTSYVNVVRAEPEKTSLDEFYNKLRPSGSGTNSSQRTAKLAIDPAFAKELHQHAFGDIPADVLQVAKDIKNIRSDDPSTRLASLVSLASAPVGIRPLIIQEMKNLSEKDTLRLPIPEFIGTTAQQGPDAIRQAVDFLNALGLPGETFHVRDFSNLSTSVTADPRN
ncbi:hypothetical protein EO087_10710 [Dyella sp. M7H15-1]|uniref:hypothetical protein n=1 Tax=Dyella sp. M7H15-1 TaxID=2501295 RepID=UPI001004FDFD|nr:hypothetical protein [Dyella sp. M7H15-1]QAU24404.1 hypothetical protein EO087_10710 [Dyella sp. M7H15-1]